MRNMVSDFLLQRLAAWGIKRSISSSTVKWLRPPEVTMATRASLFQASIDSRTARPRAKARRGLIQFGG